MSIISHSAFRTCSYDHHLCFPTKRPYHRRRQRHWPGHGCGPGPRRLPRGDCRAPGRRAAESGGELGPASRRFCVQACDVAERADVEKLFAWAEQKLGRDRYSRERGGRESQESADVEHGRRPIGTACWRSTPRASINCMYAVLAADARAQGRADRQYLVDLRQAGGGPRRRGLQRLQIRHGGARHQRRQRRSAEQHSRSPRSFRAKSIRPSWSIGRSR